MKPSFELLPFGAGPQGELESERGMMRGGGRAGRAPARVGRLPMARPAGPRLPQHGPAGGWPGPQHGPLHGQHHGPLHGPLRGPHYGKPYGPRPWPGRYGGRWPRYGWPWPYRDYYYGPDYGVLWPDGGSVTVVDNAAPDDGAGFDDGGWDQAPPPEGETPATLKDTLARLPAAQRPVYQALGPIVAALANPASAGAGLYLIEFQADGRQRAYSGQSANMRRRLQQHLLCARMLGLPVAGHQVYVAPMATLSPTQRRDLERRIHTDMMAQRPGVLTNQRRELELELLGPGWL